MTERNQAFASEYFMSEGSPRQVVHQTGTLFPMYFRDQFGDESAQHAIDYFRGPTLGFLDNATRGFLLSRDWIRQLREKELKKIPGQDALTNGHFPYAKSVESYGLTVVILSQMPALAEQPGYFLGLPHLPLTVPKDSMEMLARLDELKEFVGATGRQEITPKNLDLLSDAARRAIAFFQVGRDLLEKERLTKTQVMEMLNDPSCLDEELARILRNTPLN